MRNDLYTSTYNPDVLSCIANLSNDEVFTPPEVANAMLDLLPQELVDAITPAFALKVTRLRILRAYGLSSDRADSGCGRRCGSGGRVGEF